MYLYIVCESKEDWEQWLSVIQQATYHWSLHPLSSVQDHTVGYPARQLDYDWKEGSKKS